jgi:hypothetical protein
MSLGLAFKAFFAVLFNREVRPRVANALKGTVSDSSSTAGSLTGEAKLPTRISDQVAQHNKIKLADSQRSDAITLLSALQREARFVDLVCESLDEFSDAQIGAAAREVLRDSRLVLDRMFAIKPLSELDEGQASIIDAGVPPSRVRLVGKTGGSNGVVVHRGWQVTKCEMPVWKGEPADVMILAPTELEIR